MADVAHEESVEKRWKSTRVQPSLDVIVVLKANTSEQMKPANSVVGVFRQCQTPLMHPQRQPIAGMIRNVWNDV